MIRKTDIVKNHIKSRNYKEALRIAKGFAIGISEEQRKEMSRAYECILYPKFYKQLGIIPENAIKKGIDVLISIYG